MRISDWSSDVCSSDLGVTLCGEVIEVGPLTGGFVLGAVEQEDCGSPYLQLRTARRAGAGGLDFSFGSINAGPLRVPVGGFTVPLRVVRQFLQRVEELGRAWCRARVCQDV